MLRISLNLSVYWNVNVFRLVAVAFHSVPCILSPPAQHLYLIESLHPPRYSLTDATERVWVKETFCIWHISFSFTFLLLQKSRKERWCMACPQPCWRPCQEICCFLTCSFSAFIVTCVTYGGWVECEVHGFKCSCTPSWQWCGISHFELFNSCSLYIVVC